jgi:(1->4)-alpha-D-glucan 1-alpha-D-glucosylmutase
VLRYFDHVLPLRDGVADLPLGVLLAQQHYRLTDWHDAATQLNYRRFFDIDSLIALRVEDPDVFDATHRVLLRLVHEGLIDGLRVDHPDGLADPRGYLARLSAETGGAWVVVEKILAHGEELPDWPCAGTTDTTPWPGRRPVHDPAGDVPLTDEYVRFTGGKQSFSDVERDAKRDIADGTFAAELARLTRLFARAGYPALDGYTAADLHDVLVALLAEFRVYRAYVTPGEPPSPAAAAAGDRGPPPRPGITWKSACFPRSTRCGRRYSAWAR